MAEKTAQERRAAGRKQRRPPAHIPEEAGSAEISESVKDDPSEALRAAASAAVAAAAVGAAQALVRRRRGGDDETSEPEDGTPTAETEEADPAEERQGFEPSTDDEPSTVDEHEPVRAASRADTRRIVDCAREQLHDLRGVAAESVSSIRHTADGWHVGLEVVEVRRVPESTDVLATYRLELDDEGNLLNFERTARYYRSEADHR
jgi:Gas vesicle synthesis protein GvpO